MDGWMCVMVEEVVEEAAWIELNDPAPDQSIRSINQSRTLTTPPTHPRYPPNQVDEAVAKFQAKGTAPTQAARSTALMVLNEEQMEADKLGCTMGTFVGLVGMVGVGRGVEGRGSVSPRWYTDAYIP